MLPPTAAAYMAQKVKSVDYDPFGAAVDYDPFGKPVEYDPFKT